MLNLIEILKEMGEIKWKNAYAFRRNVCFGMYKHRVGYFVIRLIDGQIKVQFRLPRQVLSYLSLNRAEHAAATAAFEKVMNQ